MRVGPLSTPVDVSMKDALKDLDMAAMGILEAGYGRWSLGADITCVKVSEEIAGGGRLFRSFRLEQKQWVINPNHSRPAFGARNPLVMDVAFPRGGHA